MGNSIDVFLYLFYWLDYSCTIDLRVSWQTKFWAHLWVKECFLSVDTNTSWIERIWLTFIIVRKSSKAFRTKQK